MISIVLLQIALGSIGFIFALRADLRYDRRQATKRLTALREHSSALASHRAALRFALPVNRMLNLIFALGLAVVVVGPIAMILLGWGYEP